MLRVLIAIVAPFSAVSMAATQSGPPVAEVHLSNFDFAPGTIRLRAGQPVVLRIVNASGGGHNFSAPDFFAAARVQSGAVRNGTVEVRGGQSVDLTLVPRAGTYRLRCTHTFHTALGMRGSIVVQ